MITARVCIDAFNLDMAKGSGIATYARNLGAALETLGAETHLLHGPARAPGGNDLLNEIAIWEPRSVKPPRAKLWQFLQRPFRPAQREAVRISKSGELEVQQNAHQDFGARYHWSCGRVFHGANRDYVAHGDFTTLRFGPKSQEKQIDIAHWTCPLPIRAERSLNIYTIHDLVPLKLPFATLDDKPRHYEICKRICREADQIVTVSEKSRDDIVRIFGVDEHRITNTYQSVSVPSYFLADNEGDISSAVENTFGLPWKGYFLFFGAVEPKKNLGRLIEAYLASGASAPLVIVGGRAWLDEDDTRMLHQDLIQVQVLQDGVLRRADRIRRYDYLPFGTLMGLVKGAKATMFPSLYEGFGLPILESMLLGTPVLTSNTGASLEIAGDATLLVDPYDVQAIKRGIQALDIDDALCAELSARGQIQAARFSPEAYERRLEALYHKLL